MKNVSAYIPKTGLIAVAIIFMAVVVAQMWMSLPPKSTEPRKALRSTGNPKDLSLSELRAELIDIYNVPLCYELPSRSSGLRSDQIKSFQIRRNESLQNVLDQIVQNNPAFEWRKIHDSIILAPKKQDGNEIASNLDVKVSLNLSNVSAGEAFEALEDEINANSTLGTPIDIYPACLANGRRPPAEFDEVKTVAVELEDATAREAACAIIKATPLDIAWSFGAWESMNSLLLSFSKDGNSIRTEMMSSGDEIEAYSKKYLGIRGRVRK